MDEASNSIVKYLPPSALHAFSRISKTTNIAAKEEAKDPVYWKKQLENELGYELPFHGDANYWKNMYIHTYPVYLDKRNPFVEMYDSGDAVLIYIALKNGVKGNVNRSAHLAIMHKDTEALELLVSDPRLQALGGDYILLTTAISDQYDDAVNLLISLLVNVDTSLSDIEVQSPFETAAYVGRVDYMRQINEVMPYKGNLFKRGSFSDTLTPEQKSKVLEYFLSLRIVCPYHVSAFARPTYIIDYSSMSVEEIQVLISSNCVVFDALTPSQREQLRLLDAQQSYLVYTSKQSIDVDDVLFLNMVRDSNVLRKVLSGTKYSNELLDSALQANTDSIRLIVDKFSPSRDQQITSLKNNISEVATIPLLFVANTNDLSVEDIENMIVEHPKVFVPQAIQAFSEAGVSLKLVRATIAFHTDIDGLKVLLDLGYHVKDIAPNLIRASELVTVDEVVDLFKDPTVIKGVYITDKYSKYRNDTPSIDKQVTNITKGMAPSYGTDWYTTDYSWIERIPDSVLDTSAMKRGIQQMKVNKQRQILYRLSENNPIQDIREWLLLATELTAYIVVTDTNPINIIIGDTIVHIPAKAIDSKYRLLDMFSDEGVPLTTVEDIKTRRRELLPR